MQPLNLSDEAHDRGYYIDPTDPTQQHLVGVTTAINAAINKPFLVTWRTKLAAEWAANNAQHLAGLDADVATQLILDRSQIVADHSRNKGTIVHRFMELYAAGENPDPNFDHDTQGHINAGLKFFAEHKPEIIWVEATVFNPSAGYAGTCDLIARIGGEVWIIDYKSGSKLSPEVALQQAALANCTHGVTVANVDGVEQTIRVPLPKIDRHGVVHLKANGNYTFKEIPNAATWTPTFLAAVSMWQFVNGPNPIGAQIPAGPVTDPDRDRYDTLRTRALNLKAHSEKALEYLAQIWSADLATVLPFNATDRYNEAEAVAVESLLREAERLHEAPFTEFNEPFTPQPLKPAPEPVEIVDGNDPIIHEIIFRIKALPPDLGEHIETTFRKRHRMPKLSSGQATRTQIGALIAEIETAEQTHLARNDTFAATVAIAATFGINTDELIDAFGTVPDHYSETDLTMFAACVTAYNAGQLTLTAGQLELTETGMDELNRIGKREATQTAKTLGLDPAPTKFADLVANPRIACAVLTASTHPKESGQTKEENQ